MVCLCLANRAFMNQNVKDRLNSKLYSTYIVQCSCRTSYAHTHTQVYMYSAKNIYCCIVKCTEFDSSSSREIKAFGVVWFRTVMVTVSYTDASQRTFHATNYLLHYAGSADENNEKKGVYCYCYWTNNFFFSSSDDDDDGWRAVAAREINANCIRATVKTSDLKSYFVRVFLFYLRSSHSLFISNWIRDYSSFLFIDFNSTKCMYFHLMSP